MTSPQLTIGIPTFDRHRFLKRAIDSCLRQTVDVHVIVADQGGLAATYNVLEQYADNPRVEHLRTRAGNLWQNWEAAARACDTPFFAWLQDDDIVAPAVTREDGSIVPGTGFAHRALAAFERFPEALHWQGRLYCGVCPEDGTLDDVMASWWGQSGPWVLMPIIRQAPLQWPGQVLVPTSYLTAWCLSPAVAFRCGEEFNRALSCMPEDASLMNERLIVASMGMQGPFIADPVVAGYWIHHGGNESYKQHVDQGRQTEILIEHLDECMDRTDWEEIFGQWCAVMNPMQILGFMNNFECDASRYADRLKEIMAKSLKGRVEQAEAPAHRNGKAQGNGVADRSEALVWS